MDKQAPLTYDQLKDMDGQPVWVEDGNGRSFWALVSTESEWAIDNQAGISQFVFYDMKGSGAHGLHYMSWLAYAQKPAL